VVNAYDGASPEYFEQLDLPKVLLPTTWRCRPEHWNLATAMLARSHEPPEVDIRHDSGLVREYDSPRFEYSSDLGWVTLPGADRPASPGQLVREHDGSTLFLARTQLQADGVGAALERAGVPYRSQQELRGWNTEDGAVKLHLHNALQKFEGYGPANFGYTGNAAFDQFQGNQRDPRSERLTADEAATTLEAVNARTLSISRSDAEERAETLRDSDESVTLREFDEWVSQEFWERYTAGAGSVDRLNKSVFTDARRDLNALRAALNHQDASVDAEDIDTWSITIHASKGMEADDVVVYDGISNRILQEMRHHEATRNNEHRTWYVALSRARKRLHIMRNGFEWTSSIVPENLGEVVV
jgi:DNA helicase-2/ATP-dependent DNA helicase PcrA